MRLVGGHKTPSQPSRPTVLGDFFLLLLLLLLLRHLLARTQGSLVINEAQVDATRFFLPLSFPVPKFRLDVSSGAR